jgi:hypothetical protein
MTDILPAAPPATPPQFTWFQRMFMGIQNVLSHDVWPWIQSWVNTVALDELAMVKTHVEFALAGLDQDLVALAQTGNTEAFFKVFNATVASTVQSIEAAGLNIAKGSIITGVQIGLHNLLTAIPGTAPQAGT